MKFLIQAPNLGTIQTFLAGLLFADHPPEIVEKGSDFVLLDDHRDNSAATDQTYRIVNGRLEFKCEGIAEYVAEGEAA